MDVPDLQQLIIKGFCDSILSARLYLFGSHCVLYLKKKECYPGFFFKKIDFFRMHRLLTKRKKAAFEVKEERVKGLRSATCRKHTSVMTDALVLCP